MSLISILFSMRLAAVGEKSHEKILIFFTDLYFWHLKISVTIYILLKFMTIWVFSHNFGLLLIWSHLFETSLACFNAWSGRNPKMVEIISGGRFLKPISSLVSFFGVSSNFGGCLSRDLLNFSLLTFNCLSMIESKRDL